MNLYFSLIVPVFNRPDEIKELLQSLEGQTYDRPYEIVIVEDGSTEPAQAVVLEFSDRLTINYLTKPNSGPGDSRNYGMRHASGAYFIILDSDCILPTTYLERVEASLQQDYVHCFGGPDAAHPNFTLIQKAINYAMTALLTTGGIRGNKRAVSRFQPRSFNMGLSRVVFEKVGGFGDIHPGEDPDLTIRIWNAGFRTKLIPDAFVYHKRRIDWKKFFIQVRKFGMVRPILNKWHPQTARATYWFPSIFVLGLCGALVLAVFGIALPLWLYGAYFLLVLLDSLIRNGSLSIALLSLVAVMIQFFGYGLGFLKSSFWITFMGQEPRKRFPKLFFTSHKVVERDT